MAFGDVHPVSSARRAAWTRTSASSNRPSFSRHDAKFTSSAKRLARLEGLAA